MIRRRDLYASFVVWGVSAAWCAVVWLYSVGGSRRERALRCRVDDLESRLSVLESRPVPEPCSCSSLSSRRTSVAGYDDGDDDGDDVPFRPRLIGRGRTKSPVRPWVYFDIEVAPGSIQRRYFPLPSSSDVSSL